MLTQKCRGCADSYLYQIAVATNPKISLLRIKKILQSHRLEDFLGLRIHLSNNAWEESEIGVAKLDAVILA